MTAAAFTPSRPVRRGGPTFLTHTLLLTGRQLRAAWRMPAFLVMNLVQPVIWLLLFGQLQFACHTLHMALVMLARCLGSGQCAGGQGGSQGEETGNQNRFHGLAPVMTTGESGQ